MGRRTGLLGLVESAAEMIDAAEEKSKQNSVNYRGVGPKERTPTYSLQRVVFNQTTKIATINIVQSQEYRTIERYVTQNYVKHPIYSDWKTRTKSISRALKISDETLESLNRNDDELIKMFASDIIAELGDRVSKPSWYLKNIINNDEKTKCELLSKEKQIAILKFSNETKGICLYADKISLYSSHLEGLYKRNESLLAKTKTKIDRLMKGKDFVVLKIITFGIYAFFVSDKRISKLQRFAGQLEEAIEKEKRIIRTCKSVVERLNDEKNRRSEILSVIKKNYDRKIFLEQKNFENKRCKITSLTGSEEERYGCV